MSKYYLAALKILILVDPDLVPQRLKLKASQSLLKFASLLIMPSSERCFVHLQITMKLVLDLLTQMSVCILQLVIHHDVLSM